MEEGIPCKSVELSDKFKANRADIYRYTIDVFGYNQAERYMKLIESLLSMLSTHYLMYPEWRHIATKSRKYRNIILDSHLIIYRITALNIEVLTILHSASSIGKIRGVRSIRIIK